jgi:hypothetical protein
VIQYVVVCACTGRVEPIAYLEDDRESGGRLTVRPGGDSTAQLIIGAIPTIDGEPALGPLPAGTIETGWKECSVSETAWDSGRFTWVIRCNQCRKQVQMSDVNYSAIADALATNLDVLARCDEGYLIPLGVLLHHLGTLNR